MKASVPDVLNVYNQAMQDTMVDPRFTEAFKAGGKVSPDAQKRLNRLVEAMAMQTAQTMQNFSNTTAISESYRKHVDRAVTAASTGFSSYSAVMRQALREIGSNGLQVVYESGYHRRLDTALRQNIIDGINQISQRGAEIVGEELGYDAVEITAHLHSAPDHEPVQGRVFLNAEYEKMQTDQPFTDVIGKAYAAFRRPIQEWNCKHFALPFSTKYSKPRYTEKQLQDWAAANEKGCIINGKHLTTYEATQVMRKLELEQRKQKDIANAARVAGDDVLRRQCQQRINELAVQYQAVSDACGVRAQWERTSVEGFKAIKVTKEQLEIDKLQKARQEWDKAFDEKYKAKNESELLPNVNNPFGVMAKLTDYCLNKEHESGKNKAIVFESALGYTQSNADLLYKEITSNIRVYKAEFAGYNGFGNKYNVLMPIKGTNGKIQPVLTSWIDAGKGDIRMVTAYVEKENQRP